MDLDAIDGRFVPTARPGVGSVLVGREIVLALIPDGTSYAQTAALNESGSIVWQCFDGSGTIDEIAADIAGVFGAEIADVRADVVALARAVGAAGYLLGVDEAEGIAPGLPLAGFDAAQPGRRSLMVSWSPTCQYCALIADELTELVPVLADAGVDVVLTEEAFGGLGTPAAYLVDEHGLVVEPAALGATDVLAIARRYAS